MSALLAFRDRSSPSPFIERVWRSHSTRDGTMRSIAAVHSEIVVVRHQGRHSVHVRGPETRPALVDVLPDGEWFAIRLKVGAHLPLFPPGALRDRNDIALPDASGRKFWLHGSAWEYPTEDDAEAFVDRLAREGLLVIDPVVAGVMARREPQATTRTQQRRFLRATGLTRGTIHQVERARHAAILLRQGAPLSAVAYDAGYFDQAHLTRAMRRWIGLTPSQLAGTAEQLSFLYKTHRP